VAGECLVSSKVITIDYFRGQMVCGCVERGGVEPKNRKDNYREFLLLSVGEHTPIAVAGRSEGFVCKVIGQRVGVLESSGMAPDFIPPIAHSFEWLLPIIEIIFAAIDAVEKPNLLRAARGLSVDGKRRFSSDQGRIIFAHRAIEGRQRIPNFFVATLASGAREFE